MLTYSWEIEISRILYSSFAITWGNSGSHDFSANNDYQLIYTERALYNTSGEQVTAASTLAKPPSCTCKPSYCRLISSYWNHQHLHLLLLYLQWKKGKISYYISITVVDCSTLCSYLGLIYHFIPCRKNGVTWSPGSGISGKSLNVIDDTSACLAVRSPMPFKIIKYTHAYKNI